MRLTISYPSRLYFDKEIDDPLHPDRLIENRIGQQCSDAGMGMRQCGDRDIGFEPWEGDREELTQSLKDLDFRVTVTILRRSEDRKLKPEHIFNLIPQGQR